ncbi:MAG: MBL fold metallo-hydrolase [Elainellaceae cyanobacterium]
MHLTWLDNNSWLIELGGQRILLDPWLIGPLVFGNLSWLIRGQHLHPRPIPEAIDLILLSQGLEDHAHPQTLKQLDRAIPVIASPNAAKVVQALGFTQVTALAHGESHTVADRLQIKAFPGAPIGPLLVENGYLLTGIQENQCLYYEPHGYPAAELVDVAPVDVLITPLVDLKVPLVGAVVRGGEHALQAIEWLKPQVVLPTAAGGKVKFDGLLASVLQTGGSLDEFRALLQQRHGATRVIAPQPGERFEVELSSVSY